MVLFFFKEAAVCMHTDWSSQKCIFFLLYVKLNNKKPVKLGSRILGCYLSVCSPLLCSSFIRYPDVKKNFDK